MNRRSVLRRIQLPIDVTALLDVVFLVLLIVICHQQDLASAGEAKAAEEMRTAVAIRTEAEALQADAEAAKALYEDRLDTEEHLSDYLSILTVYVDYTPGNPRERQIRLLDDRPGAEPVTFVLTPETEETALQSLAEALQARMEQAAGSPVILSLNLERILYRDEEAVHHLFSLLQSDYDNLYFK